MKCSFCSKEIREATGTMYVRKSGKVSYFCTSKCENNLVKLGRNPRKKKWAHEKIIKTEKKKENLGKKEVSEEKVQEKPKKKNLGKKGKMKMNNKNNEETK